MRLHSRQGPSPLHLESEPPTDPRHWHHVFWSPETRRLVVGKVMVEPDGPLDDEAVYEIELPEDPSDTWTVTRQPFVAGTLPSQNTWQNFWYLPAVKTAFIFPSAAVEGDDVVFAFRPHGT